MATYSLPSKKKMFCLHNTHLSMLGGSLSSESSVEWSSFSAAGVEALEVERLKGDGGRGLARVSQGARLGLEGHRPN